MFVHQLCIKVQIHHTKDRLGVRICIIWKCGSYKSRMSESQGPSVYSFPSAFP